MTPQATFMILAPIVPQREADLRNLLESMNVNREIGRVDPNNALVPFAKLESLHFARFVILDDQTVQDVRSYGLPVRTYPLYLGG